MNVFFKGTKMVFVLLILLVTITGCITKKPVSPDENQSLSNQPQNTKPIENAVNETPVSEVKNIPSNPPVEYDPAWPDQAVRSSSGHLVNSCVPEDLRDKATTLTTSDGVHLSALVLGSGDKGVLLAHEQGYNICSFLDMGTELADSGYLVVIPEYRNHGASQNIPEDNQNIDRDADAALSELKRLGAKRVFLAGASCGGSTAIIAGVRQALPIVGLIILSSPAQCGPLDAIPSVEKIKAPSVFVFSPGDYGGSIEKEVRKLYQASGATDKELIVDESGYHGTDMYHRGEHGDVLKSKLIDFVKKVFN
ncbi:alpha/beta hydrolase [Paenibacillus sp. VMFN-D1]|uniref:alpha/beta hydrolase n=1 Tax=Paenibacillus sp. VMFN-D1 TaxID=2135608 RepID=UPI000E24C8DC|nr:alpha/beta hydrolase [Paenibacillus sp. VMFN-D1]RED40247.1 serine aminopeptidase S33 family [Paenibacillus sp. VMFN-D1]